MRLDADKIHHAAFVADMHCDTVLPVRRGYDLGQRHTDYHVDLPRLIEGGVNLQVFASLASPYASDRSPYSDTARTIETLHREIERHHEQIAICLSADGIRAVHASGRIAAVLSIEGGLALEDDPANLQRFYDMGIRLITIVHDQSTGWCIGWGDKSPAFPGLNDLGRDMIAEMNRLGIIVDLSHSSDGTFAEVMKTTTKPVVASHSCARALCNHGRNLTDQQLRQLAANGGMVGAAFVSFFLTNEFSQTFVKFFGQRPDLDRILGRLFVSEMPEEELQAELAQYLPEIEELEAPLRPLRPTVGKVVDHIEHMVGIAGADHVGLGSDFDGMSMPPRGLDDCSQMPNITRELVKRDCRPADIEKILGGNFLRVFKTVCG